MTRIAYVCLVGFLICSWGPSHMTPANEEATADSVVARIALLALRRAAGGSPVDRFVVLPSEEKYESDQASRVLAEMPKPLECLANTSGGLIFLSCQSVRDPNRLRDHLAQREMESRVLGERIKGYAEGQESPVVELRGAGESLVVDLASFQRWLLDYSLPGAFVVRPGEPQPANAETKVVVEFFAS